MKKKLYLVDVSSLFFRAFYAIRPLTSPSGMPVNAIYGFASMILKLLKDEKPDKMVFCYDRKEPSFRKDLYVDYKANRTEMPEELGVQIPYIKKLADLLGIPSLEVEGFEADDIIGTLSQIGKTTQHEVFIVSGDKDFAQLLNGDIFIYDTMKNIKYDQKTAKEKWGIDPHQMIDYLALVGDSSDNVPGVAGIGPKGAAKLLEEFGSLENIYKNLALISSASLREKLEKSKENAFLSKQLVTICLDVPLSKDMNTYSFKPAKKEELLALLKELNFQNMIKSLSELNLHNSESPTTSPAVSILPQEELSKVQVPVESKSEENISSLVQAQDLNEFFQSVENELGLFLIGKDIYLLNEKSEYFPVLEFEVNRVKELLLLGKQKLWWGFDLKSIWHQLQWPPESLPEKIWDSQLAAYSLKAGDMSSLKRVCEWVLERNFTEDVRETLSAQYELREKLDEKLKDHGHSIFVDLELPLAPLLYKMEYNGVRLDLDFLKIQSLELGKDLSRLEEEIIELAGEKFNVASPKQLSQILFDRLQLPVIKKTKTGLSTDNEVLEKLDHPIAKKVLEYRELAKLKSTYIDALPQLVDSDHRVHTRLNQALTTTGRLSSTNPNLQNIPIRTERGQKVRRAFIADPGLSLLSVDYSQVELRVLAHISEDKNLIQAFQEDLDVHSATASEVFSVALKDVTSDLRRTAKAINFGIAYGQGPFGLAETLGISRTEAKDIIQKYFAKFQGVQHYIESTIKSAHENGYVETLFGRRRYIEELQSKSAALKSFGERAAINAPIQGTASDLIKKAMIEISNKVSLKLILQVHDELIFEGASSELEAHQYQVKQLMENVVSWKVPLKVNMAIGRNWEEAHS